MPDAQGRPIKGEPVFINGIPVINNLDNASNYAVNLANYEIITQSLYDSAAYPAAGINLLNFFQVPIGGGLGVLSAAPKTPEDTNMQQAGAMPNMQAFVVTSIELDVQAVIPFVTAENPAVFGAQAVAAQVNDQWKIRATGWLNLTIGQKPYLIEGPLMKFPASNDLEINAALADVSTAGAAFQSRIAIAKAVGPAYVLSPNNLLLIPMQNFVLSLNWATLSTVSVPARIFARLMGQLLRAGQ